VSLRGYIDGVIGDELVGWALEEEVPGRRLHVRGELDGVVLGTVEASEPREDLVRAGFGDGSYGFRIQLDPRVLTPGIHPVAAIVGERLLPLARDWIVRDEEDRPLESVLLAPGAPAAAGATVSAVAPPPEPAVTSPTRPAPPPPQSREPGLVLAGAGGWTFLASAGVAAGSHEQLDTDAAAVEELYALAAPLGVVARAVMVPAKRLVYAEHLAPEHRIDPGRRPARAVSARLRDSSDATLLDLYDALQDARAHGRIYPRTGERLTWTGAVHAYRAIMKTLTGAPFRSHPVAAFEFGRLAEVDDALDGADTEPLLTVRPSAAAAGAPTGLIVHDGTAGRVAELLRIHFWRTEVVVADRATSELLQSARADVVIWIRQDG